MITAIVILAYLASGLLGAFLVHANWQWSEKAPICPSPAQILKICFGSLLGPCIFGASIAIWLIDLLSAEDNEALGDWWTTPVCKKYAATSSSDREAGSGSPK